VERAYRPLSLAEALDIIDSEEVVPLAGGTDLMVQYRSWSGLPPQIDKPIMFIGHLEELRGAVEEEDGLFIGSSTTLTSLLAYGTLPQPLKSAVARIAGPSIRNRATIGGNLCNASPAADSLTPLYVLGAEVMLGSSSGRRILPIGDFITGPGKTCLARNELLLGVRIPNRSFNLRYFRKVGTRAAYSCAKLALAAACRTAGGRVADMGIALGAVAPLVVRSDEAEQLLQGLNAREIEERIPQILGRYDGVIDPIDDQRSSAFYRRRASLRLIRHFIQQILVPQLREEGGGSSSSGII
jgi:CO/xanthine dehydrogenase FAD-binding subunit